MSDSKQSNTAASTLRQRRTGLNANPINEEDSADVDDAFSAADSADVADAAVAAAARATHAVANPPSAVPASPAAAAAVVAVAARRRRAADDGDPLPGEMMLLLLFVVLVLCGAFLILFSPAFQRGGFASMTQSGGSGRKMHDSSIHLRVNLESIVRGETVRFDLPSPGRQRRCPHCAGTGGKATPCAKCGGAGQVQMKRQVAPGFYQTFHQNCAACGGRGKHIASPCSHCHGAGTVHDRAPISLRIPAGAPEGWTATLSACGDDPAPQHASMGVGSGDLVVEVGSRPDDRFRREGKDLHTEVEIQLREALVGFARDIQLLDGSTLRVQSDGLTLPDSRMTFAGRGMPAFTPAIALEAEAEATELALGSSRASEESLLGSLGSAVQGALRSMGLASRSKSSGAALQAIPAGDLIVSIKVRWPRGPLSEQQKQQLRTLLGNGGGNP